MLKKPIYIHFCQQKLIKNQKKSFRHWKICRKTYKITEERMFLSETTGSVSNIG